MYTVYTTYSVVIYVSSSIRMLKILATDSLDLQIINSKYKFTIDNWQIRLKYQYFNNHINIRMTHIVTFIRTNFERDYFLFFHFVQYAVFFMLRYFINELSFKILSLNLFSEKKKNEKKPSPTYAFIFSHRNFKAVQIIHSNITIKRFTEFCFIGKYSVLVTYNTYMQIYISFHFSALFPFIYFYFLFVFFFRLFFNLWCILRTLLYIFIITYNMLYYTSYIILVVMLFIDTIV